MIGILIKSLNNTGVLTLITGILTIIVGFSAIYLYIRQKREYKRDAASLILQEIRYAEQQIRNFKVLGSYPLSVKLLPTNNWNNHIHLFVKDFKETELDLISDFYAKSAYLDIVIANISDVKNKMLIPKNHFKGDLLKEESVDDKEKKIIEQIKVRSTEFEFGSKQILNEVSQKIEFIYNTPAIDKLRTISIKQWYHLC